MAPTAHTRVYEGHCFILQTHSATGSGTEGTPHSDRAPLVTCRHTEAGSTCYCVTHTNTKCVKTSGSVDPSALVSLCESPRVRRHRTSLRGKGCYTHHRAVRPGVPETRVHMTKLSRLSRRQQPSEDNMDSATFFSTVTVSAQRERTIMTASARSAVT